MSVLYSSFSKCGGEFWYSETTNIRDWNPVKDTRAKGQIGQSQPFWRLREAGYKTRSQRIALFLPQTELAQTATYKHQTVTIRKPSPPPSMLVFHVVSTCCILCIGTVKPFVVTKTRVCPFFKSSAHLLAASLVWFIFLQNLGFKQCFSRVQKSPQCRPTFKLSIPRPIRSYPARVRFKD